MNPPTTSRFLGRDLAGNHQAAAAIADKIRRVRGAVDVRVQQPSDLPRFEFAIDRTKASKLGLFEQDIASSFQLNLSGSTQVQPTLPSPTYISELSFDEMELYCNWGSAGEIIVNGISLEGNDVMDFGRLPYNDGIADTTYRTHYFELNELVRTVALRVWDITDVSKIFADNIALVTVSSTAPTGAANDLDPTPKSIFDSGGECIFHRHGKQHSPHFIPVVSGWYKPY